MFKPAIVFLLLAAFSAAETPSAARGKKVIDDAIAALGGDKFLEMQDRVETALIAAFRAARGAPTRPGKPANQVLAQFDYWRIRNAFAVSYAQLSALRRRCH